MNATVIGGGASGMMCAALLARGGVKVTLVEKNDKLGKKLFITGKGRCNLTNDCDADTLKGSVVRGERFLRSAFAGFSPRDAMEYFEKLGVGLKVERGGRVFPASDRSSDVIRALEREMARCGVKTRLECEVAGVKCEGGKFVSALKSGEEIKSDFLVVATGGVSYPLTGSTGDGYKFAKGFGHSVIEPMQSLVALNVAENVSSLAGLSLKNVCLSAYSCGKKVVEEFGEMLFTPRGMSGPIVLTVSSYTARMSDVKLSLDLKPALDEETLDARLLRELSERQNQDMKNVMRSLAPERLNLYLLARAGISADKKANSLTKKERTELISVLKGLKFSVTSRAPFSEAVITAGGVELKELTPKCESKKMSGLYFIGEVIDADALTGGFNLQIAWATAFAAAKDILQKAGSAE